MEPIRFNTMDTNDFRQRMSDVLHGVATRIGRTLGPYGHNVIIPYGESSASTKDGWNCLMQLTLDNPIDRYIKGMIEKCGQSVILKVGDGSTTVTIAADELTRLLLDSDMMDKYNIRDIEDALVRCTNKIISRLQEMSTPITPENMGEMIKKVALVSTNWDDELAQMIADIYTTTNNPIIKIQDSGTDKTFVEYINGYDIAGMLCLESYYLTNRVEGICEVKNPLIIALNYNVPHKMAMSLIMLGNLAESMGRPLVVLAPEFDQVLLQTLATQNRLRSNSGKNYVNVVPVRYVNTFIIDKECVDDFCVMTGSALMYKDDDDFIDFLDNITKALSTGYIQHQDGESEEEKLAIDTANEERMMIIEAAERYIDQIAGTCDKLTISNKHIVAQGLTKCNDKLVEERKELLNSEISSKTKEFDALTMLTEDIRMKRIRLGKLQKNMGIIKIGGYGDGNLKARRDAVDDATRACESAYYNGVIFGSGTAIGAAILNIARKEFVSDIDSSIYDGIYTAFKNVFNTLLHNKFNRVSDTMYPSFIDPSSTGTTRNLALSKHEDLSVDKIYIRCAREHAAYDVKIDYFDINNTVFNPVNVDIEVLKGCMRLVTMCITSDQMIVPQHAMDILHNKVKQSLELPDDIQEVK